VRRHGKLILSWGHSADLDSLDRDWNTDSGQWDILVSSDYIGGYTALWVTSRTKTDHRACADERFMLNTGDLRANDVRAGTNLCVQTDEGRLALLHVDRITTAAGRDFDSVAFTATVWEDAMNAGWSEESLPVPPPGGAHHIEVRMRLVR
jgi:hypothetical protein